MEKMAKHVKGSKSFSVETRANRAYDNKSNYPNSNQRSQSAYFEFEAKDQIYSYAVETDWQGVVSNNSSGTTSYYTKGRVGINTNGTKTNYSENTQQQPFSEQYVSGQGLSDSTKSTSTTYDKIVEHDMGLQVGKRVNQRTLNNAKARSCALGRITLITVILLVLIAVAGVLVYVFVINRNDSQVSGCESSPTVLNAQIIGIGSTPKSVIVTCNQGHELHGNGTMSCTEGTWSQKPSCDPIKCGPYPHIENGEVIGTDRQFGSAARIECDLGFLVEDSTIITCLVDGNWSTATGCHEHPCGIYTPSHDMMVIEALTLSKMTLCLKCKPGLRYFGDGDQCVTCDNGEWIGKPTCEIPGFVYFDPPQTVYNVDDHVALTCVVHESSEWQSIVVARRDFHDSEMEPLFHFKNVNGEIQTEQHINTGRFHASHEFTTDGVVFALEIDQAQCEDSGVYVCANIVGAVDTPDKLESTNTSVHVTDTRSDVPEVIVPDVLYVGIEDNLKCTGEIGKDKNDTKLGTLIIQIKYKNTDSFKNLSFVTENVLSQNCRINKTIVSTLIPEIDMHEAAVQCVVLTSGELELTSTQKSLNIVSATVQISTAKSTFTFGETATIMVILDNINGWDLIEVRKSCSGADKYVARIRAGVAEELLLIGDHVQLSEKEIMPDSARFVVNFDSVKCSDACGSAGLVEYILAVRINNATWIENSSTIMFQKQPDTPTLQVPYDVVAGNTAFFVCTGEIGEPKGYIEIESEFEGNNFTVFLSSKDGKDTNVLGSVNSVTDESDDCSNMRTIHFIIKELTPKFHQKSLRCVSTPSALLLNGQAAFSDIKAIEVIPENYCSKPDGYTGARRHPFHCNMFVSCHNGHVSGVPAGCQRDQCFQNTTCYPCETVGGCSVTDIYIDNYSDWIQLGDSVTLICKVKDLQGLTDIEVYKGSNNTIISSILGEDFEAGATKVQDESYIIGGNGQLMLYFATVQCKDASTYRCVPTGTGKHSEDETYLTLRDADGNTMC